MTRLRQPIRQRALSHLVVSVTLLGLLVPPTMLPKAAAQEAPPPSGEVIVVFTENTASTQVTAASDVAGVEPEAVYSEVFDGFAATVTQGEAEALADNPLVEAIYPNEQFWQAAQTLPTGVDRIDADQNPSADIDGSDDRRVNADVAVLDSGISTTTGDLNIVGGVNCADDGIGPYDDRTGHGTHVAGTVAALDNGSGVVGVAPGARLWSVRVLNRFGGGSSASLICGLDWAARRASVIDVVNMSIEGTGTDGDCDNSAIHLAICAVVVDAGIPVVVAAGNHGEDAANWIPAAYDEVIAVSSVADFDGRPGADAPNSSCSSGNSDDRFAHNSNFGADIDIAAPGVCIVSLVPGGGIASKSGTSMATPHVTGAVALYLAVNKYATPAAVKSWLRSTGRAQSSAQGFTGDPDSSPERMLWLGGGDPVATAPTPTPTTAWKPVRSGASANSAPSVYVRDGRRSTVWKTRTQASPPTEAWVWIDLGARKPIGTIRWVFGQYGIGDYFEIHGSNNLLTWQYITKRNGKRVGLWQEKTLNNNYRYIRFRFKNPNRDRILGGISEVQVWAPGVAPPLSGTATTATPSQSPAVSYDLVTSAASVNSAASTYVRDDRMSPIWKTKRFRAGAPREAWVWVDLGARKPIGTIRWVFGEYGIGDYFEIEGSNDGRSWSYITKRNGKPVGAWQEKTLSASYRYVRFRFENPRGDLTLGGLAEVQVWSPGSVPPLGSASSDPPPTPVPPATAAPDGPYPLYGSGRSGNSTLPRSVWDGDPGTTWQTNGASVPSSAYVYVTLGSIKPIGAIRWLYGTADIGDQLTIQVSNDRLSWTDVHTAGNAPVDVWQARSFAGLEAKYVRWRFANPNGDPVIGGLAEVEIYAPGVYQGGDTAAPTVTETATPAPTETGAPVPTETTPPLPGETAGSASPETNVTETPAVTEIPEVDETPLDQDQQAEPRVDVSPTETAFDPSPPESTDPVSESATAVDREAEALVAESPTATVEPSPTEALPPTETAPAAPPTEAATEAPRGPTPYPIAQTSRSASTVSGTTAIDGDRDTVWMTAEGVDPGRVAVLTLDLGKTQNIGQLRLLPGPAGLSGAATIETSPDGETWSYYAEPDAQAADAEGWIAVGPDPEETDTSAGPIGARYVRIVFVNLSGSPTLGNLAELEVLPPTEMP